MPMPEITFRLKLFRGDWDQARSQLALLWLMEALCRVNQGHIRQAIGLAKKGMVKEPLPRLYRAGVHYEREPPEGEDWPDIPTILEKTGKDFPGPWADCLPLSTLVLASDYSLRTIGELAPGDRIMGAEGWTQVVEHVITGKKPILSFALNNGSVLRCSPNHRLFLQDGKEVRAEKVKPGDLLMTGEKIPFGEGHRDGVLSDGDFAWLLGAHIADGWAELPRRPRFSISGLDGKKKEAQKLRVKEIAEAHGINYNWNRKYIAINDRRLAEIMDSCGKRAPNKHLPFMNFNELQVKAVLEGLKADAATAKSGTVVHGTTSAELAIQLRVLYLMLGQSVHIRRWDDHGGLGQNPIYRVTVRRPVEEYADKKSAVRKAARVVAVREEPSELCCDIQTDSGKFWLPESDTIVHNCEDLACYRVAELRELGGIKAKPFAKWRKGDGGNYHYHALVLLPDGRLEDPSLTLGMGREKFFHDNGIIQAYKDGKVPVKVRYAEPPSVMVVDPESPSGYAGMKADEANAKIEAKIRQSGMFGTVLGELVRLPNIPMKDLLGVGDDLDGALGWRGDDLTPRVPMKRLERLYSMRGR